MNTVVIYTDGACSGNPGPGGWAARMECRGHVKEISGGEKYTTNNRMEMMAVVQALESLNQPCKVIVHSDSQYIVDAHEKGWIDKWIQDGWVHGRKKEEVANTDMWARLLAAEERHRMEWCKVKGHDGVEGNERVDTLAKQAAMKAAQ